MPVWEEVQEKDVAVLKDIMGTKQVINGVELNYARIPMTAEKPPDFADLSELINVMLRAESGDTPIVVNCQLGRGRSTLASVSDWLFVCGGWVWADGWSGADYFGAY